MSVSRLARRRPATAPLDLCSAFCSLYIAARGLSTSSVHRAAGGSNNASPNPMHSAPPQTTKRGDKAATGLRIEDKRPQSLLQKPGNALPAHLKMTPEQRAARLEERAKEALKAQETTAAEAGVKLGGLADNSIFADDIASEDPFGDVDQSGFVREDKDLGERSPANMVIRLNPNPNARARWTRMMVIRNIRRRGRLTREMRIARSERSHTSKSRFFTTSIKKLSPLARQIAGKTLDEAILQMRFSKKKAAKEVLKHLLQARNEAIVVRGMGLPDPNAPKETSPKPQYKILSMSKLIEAAVTERQNKTPATKVDLDAYRSAYKLSNERTGPNPRQQPPTNPALIIDPSSTPPAPTQLPSKSLKQSVQPSPTDIYVAQAWVNRGPYLKEMSPRARGRADVLRHPHTGISVMLKEEKTRSREKLEKEIKAVRKRLTGKVWTALPDRPISRQSQYILW